MTDDASPTRRYGWIAWVIGGIVVFLVFCIGWIAIRGLGAGLSLASARESAERLQTMVLTGDTEKIDAIAARIEAEAANARTLTTDPIWMGAEWVPWIGGNLRAVRQVSEVADDIASDALTPLLAAARGSDLGTLGIEAGHIDLEPLAAVAPDLAAADSVLSAAERDVRAIDGAATIPPLGDAVDEVRDEVRKIARATAMLSGAAQLLPSMLGGDTPHTYLLLMQNNAELRSSGGIPGALALLHAHDGTVVLGTQADTNDLRRLKEPVMELPDYVTALFGDMPGTYIRDTTSPPDFPTAAQLAAKVWTENNGGEIDGVIAVDAVVVSYLLDATGPLKIDGVELTTENATGTLLGDIYQTIDDPEDQDAFFRNTAATVFAALTDGSTDSRSMLAALALAGDSGRVRMWSADEAEQARILETTLSGVIPQDDADTTQLSVLLNDTTGGKMDSFADAAVDVRTGDCGPEGRTVVRLSVDLSTSAPADAAESLPDYVTAAGWWGVPPGITGTRVAVVGPQGWTATAHSADGEVNATAETEYDGRQIVQYELWTQPSSSQTLTVEFTAPEKVEPYLAVTTTPMIREVPVDYGELACG